MNELRFANYHHTFIMTHHTSIVFICMGNICRSPTAEGVFRHKARAAGLVDRIAIDSAGTHNYHPGEPPDARSQHHALRRGYDLSGLRARALSTADIERFDWLIVMDDLNYSTVRSRMAEVHRHKLRRLTEFCLSDAHKGVREVPDPYYGERADFERVLDLVEDGCDGLLAHLRETTAFR
jgi:protein-tyrosine phosphatase